MNFSPAAYIDTTPELEAWCTRCLTAPVVAVDTESDSFHRYREKVCLIQMTALGEDVIIDPLALSSLEPLRPVFLSPHCVKIFHDACYDLVCLRRDYAFEVVAIFDTMLASRLLGHRQFGLASLLQDRFAFEADKRFQRSDWAQRPLTEEQLSYAQADTHFLPHLMALLEADLRACGRYAWAQEDFARLPEAAERLHGRASPPSELGFWRVQGVGTLDAEGKGRLRALWNAREALAAAADRPPFKTVPDWALIEVAKDPLSLLSEGHLHSGLRRAGVEKYLEPLRAALRGAQPVVGQTPAGAGRKRRSGKALDPSAKERFEALRHLRREQADALGLEPEVTLANALLEDLAKSPSPSLESLVARPELRGWRAPIFAPPLFELLRRMPLTAGITSRKIDFAPLGPK